MRRRITQAVATILVAAGAVTLSGCASMPVASIGPTRNVSVDRGVLEIGVRGHDRPTVVFENGAGSPLSVWQRVLGDVQAHATTFTYNRPGYGRSRVYRNLDDPRRVVEALHQGLEAARLEPPYILVGHSLGGLYVNLFARLYPTEVAGIVLVDSSHPQQFEQLKERRPLMNAVFTSSYAIGPPERRYELQNAKRFEAALDAAGSFPDVPLRVLTAEKSNAAANEADFEWWLGLQAELTALSRLGENRIVESSGHFIQKDAPEEVVRAILELI